jgi:CDP-6-deoxy-D-xylo-4-hexulose-3-dehydrase
MIMVNDPKWVDRLVVLRGWGRRSSLFGEKANSELIKNRFSGKIAGIPYDNKFIFSEIGYNFLPLELSSAFALEQFKKLPGFLVERKKNFANLLAFFKQYENFFILPKQTPDTETAWLAFPLIIKPKVGFTRLEIVTYLEDNNIQTRPIFTGNILKQPGYKAIKNKQAIKEYVNTERIMRGGFVVACHHGLNNDQIEYLKGKFEEFLAKFNK